jgi:hypothetical protein
MKKEVSDHLSRVFFEKRVLKKQDKSSSHKIILTGCLILVFILAVFLFGRAEEKPFFAKGKDLILENHEGPYRIDFDFADTSSKIKTLKIDLGMIDIHQYESLTFSIRMSSPSTRQSNSIKVSLVNKRNEISSLYISDIDNSWKRITVPFSKFSNIHDWTSVSEVSFTCEEWNIFPKKGTLLAEGIGFTKKRIPNL